MVGRAVPVIPTDTGPVITRELVSKAGRAAGYLVTEHNGSHKKNHCYSRGRRHGRGGGGWRTQNA